MRSSEPPIPGTTIFDGDQARKGYALNRMCFSFNEAANREAFLRDASHRIVFHFTPKHASWINQVEIWFSILVRKLLRRGMSRLRPEQQRLHP